ncbi:MAG: vitamin K epoxide reductase family protein [Actinomycetota bacterium]
MSDSLLGRVIAGVATLGVAVAGYLVYVHYAGISPVCTTGGCEKVQASAYAELLGIPVALLGLVGYIAILGSLAVRGETGRMIGAGLALIGFGFSAYLTYLELFKINAICQWCVGSAVLMTLLLILTWWRAIRA